MPKVNELNININKALIKEIQLKLGNDGLNVLVKGVLLTKDNREVSDFIFGSDWYGDNKFEVPFELNNPAREIFERLTPIIYEKINGKYMSLGSGKKKNR